MRIEFTEQRPSFVVSKFLNDTGPVPTVFSDKSDQFSQSCEVRDTTKWQPKTRTLQLTKYSSASYVIESTPTLPASSRQAPLRYTRSKRRQKQRGLSMFGSFMNMLSGTVSPQSKDDSSCLPATRAFHHSASSCELPLVYELPPRGQVSKPKLISSTSMNLYGHMILEETTLQGDISPPMRSSPPPSPAISMTGAERRKQFQRVKAIKRKSTSTDLSKVS